MRCDDGEVDLTLVDPAGVNGGVDEDQVRPGALEAIDRALSAVRGAVVDGRVILRGRPAAFWVRWWSRIRFIRCSGSGSTCCMPVAMARVGLYVCDGGSLGGVGLPEEATDRGPEPAERPLTLGGVGRVGGAWSPRLAVRASGEVGAMNGAVSLRLCALDVRVLRATDPRFRSVPPEKVGERRAARRTWPRSVLRRLRG